MRRAVRDVMTTEVVVAHEDAPFKDLVALMHSARVSALPIVDGAGRLVGIVSEADLLHKQEASDRLPGAGLEDGRRAAALTAGELMTKQVRTTEPDAPLSRAARLMHEHGVKRLPVVDEDGTVVGIVSRADLLKVYLRSDRDIERDVVHDVIEATLWMEPQEAGVNVEVSAGVVRLAGTVDRRRAIRILIGLTWGIDGVVGVENALSYRIDDEELPSGRVDPWVAAPSGSSPE